MATRAGVRLRLAAGLADFEHLGSEAVDARLNAVAGAQVVRAARRAASALLDEELLEGATQTQQAAKAHTERPRCGERNAFGCCGLDDAARAEQGGVLADGEGVEALLPIPHEGHRRAATALTDPVAPR